MRKLILVIAMMTFCLSIVIPHSLACKTYIAYSPDSIHAKPSFQSEVAGTFNSLDLLCLLSETKDTTYGRWMAINYGSNNRWYYCFLLPIPASPNKPMPNSIIVPGSGTGLLISRMSLFSIAAPKSSKESTAKANASVPPITWFV